MIARPHLRLLPVMLAALLAVFTPACGGEDSGDGAPTATAIATMAVGTAAAALPATATAPPSPVPLTGTISVFAASSLTEVLTAAGEAFSEANPGVRVEFNFQSSSALAAQIEEAAPSDVYASADEAQMQRLVDEELIAGEPVVFARNLPVIVVPADNPAQITSAQDLSKSGVKLVLAAEDVPIGRYARQVIDNLAADPAYGTAFKDATLANLVSNEANVRAVLTKIELGEADAGIVYRTDALVSGDRVLAVEIPQSANVIATYPIAVVDASEHAGTAAAFVAFVLSPEGRQLLREAGFDAN